MPSSLKTKLSKLRFKGKITNEEYQEIIKKLDGHDSRVREDERNKTIEEMYELLKRIGGHFFAVDGEIYYKARDVFDIFEQKGEN